MKEESLMLQEWQAPRACSACGLAASMVFCYSDAMYLCSLCDARAHTAGLGTVWHKRVVVCDACKQAPAAYACEADAAALCAKCDIDVHSLNPLAFRHDRTPIVPVSRESLFAKEKDRQLDWPLISSLGRENQNYIEFLADHKLKEYHRHLEVDAANEPGGVCMYNHMELLNLGGKYDESDLDVPPQPRSLELDVELGFAMPKSEFTYSAPINYPMSSLSMDGSFMSDSETSYFEEKEEPSMETLEPNQTNSPSDRQARVLRYREKKKRRNFEKTIRYASRKAYAEIRPRIKGRFAKRSAPELRVDRRMPHTTISTEFTYDYGYGFGVVPSY